MNKNSIMILLVVIVVINTIAIIYLGKTSKNTPKAMKKKVNPQEDEYDSMDQEAKTEIVGRTRENESFENGLERVADSDISLSKIPNLSCVEKKEIVQETIIESNNSNEGSNETEIMVPVNKEEVVKLLTYFEDDKEMKFEMKKKEIFIGRDPQQCELIISTDKYLGKRHARVFSENKKIYVEDLESKNGTYVDGIKINGISEITLGTFKIANTEISIS